MPGLDRLDSGIHPLRKKKFGERDGLQRNSGLPRFRNIGMPQVG